MNLNKSSQELVNNIVDSHCHLDFPDYKDDINDVVNRAVLNNIKYFLTISINLENFEKIKKLTSIFPNVWCTTGIHPNNVPMQSEERILNKIFQTMELNLANKKVVGLGETGLDYYRTKDKSKVQRDFFDVHLNLSGKTNIPVIVHTRNAEKDTIDMLKTKVKKYNSKGLIHCFSSTKALAKHALDCDFYISISGIVTFKNAHEIREIIKYIPDDKLLVETDSPYLAPIPERGKRNEPSFLVHTIKKIAEIKKMSFEQVTEITTNNFFNLFSKIQK